MYLHGTYDAMPKGQLLPQQREISAHLGPVLTYEALRQAASRVPRSEQNREATRLVERAVRKLAPAGTPDHDTPVPSADQASAEKEEG
jgi:long-chain acyl-CoA synthetase